MRKVIFSVCVGDYDAIPPLRKSAGFEHIMVTDNPDLACDGWERLVVSRETNPVVQSRRYKLCPHQLFDADVYAYMDANHEVLRDVGLLIDGLFTGGFLGVWHNARATVAQETKRCIELGKADESALREQVAAYHADGFPDSAGLFANGFFVRDRSFNRFCEIWLGHVITYCARDQISLPYLVWKYRPQMTVIDYRIKEAYLRLHPHRGEKGEPSIWYFVPGAGDKNLGAALNRHCALVPDPDDWILIRDNDTFFAAPYINKQVEDIVAKHGDSFDLFSCMTNRLGLEHQLPYGLMSTPNMLELREIAERHFAKHYDEVIPTTKPTAGLFMLFRKRTWMEHPFAEGLANGPEFIDYQFSNGLLRKGKRLGICKGIFMPHYYRLHQANVREHKHLAA